MTPEQKIEREKLARAYLGPYPGIGVPWEREYVSNERSFLAGFEAALKSIEKPQPASSDESELIFAPMHFDNLPPSRNGRETRASMCAGIANQMFHNWRQNHLSLSKPVEKSPPNSQVDESVLVKHKDLIELRDAADAFDGVQIDIEAETRLLNAVWTFFPLDKRGEYLPLKLTADLETTQVGEIEKALDEANQHRVNMMRQVRELEEENAEMKQQLSVVNSNLSRTTGLIPQLNSLTEERDQLKAECTRLRDER